MFSSKCARNIRNVIDTETFCNCITLAHFMFVVENNLKFHNLSRETSSSLAVLKNVDMCEKLFLIKQIVSIRIVELHRRASWKLAAS